MTYYAVGYKLRPNDPDSNVNWVTEIVGPDSYNFSRNMQDSVALTEVELNDFRAWAAQKRYSTVTKIRRNILNG